MTDRQKDEARLRERARLLARPVQQDDQQSDDHLVVGVGGTRVAVPVDALRQTATPGPVTRLPGLPPQLRGVRALRGDVVCLADTGTLIGCSPAKEPLAQHVVVLHGQAPLGLLVDEVLGLHQLDPSQLRPPPAAVGSALSSVVSGVSEDGTLVLDAVALLVDPRLHVSPPSADEEGRP